VPAADPPKKLLDLMGKIEVDRAAVTAADQAIKADHDSLTRDQKARQAAIDAMAADRQAFRALWSDLYGDEDFRLKPTPDPKPKPPPKPPEETGVAQWALVFEDPNAREPWQEVVDLWAMNTLRGPDGASQYRRYDVAVLGCSGPNCPLLKENNLTPDQAAGYKKIIAGKPLPCIVLIGSRGAAADQTLYVGPEPKDVVGFKALWGKYQGGAK
jgi:hypothetical protein